MPIEFEIVRLGAQGDGIAETPAGPVFVPGALPGERVLVEVDGERGRLLDVVAQTPGRASPICRHFGTCGGCAAQHMGEGIYRRWKRTNVVEAFRHRGLEPPVEELVLVGPHSRRRAVLTARLADGAVVFGFSAEGTHDVVDIASCPVLVPAIERALPQLRTLAGLALGAGRDARVTVVAIGTRLDVDIAGPAPITDAERRAALAQLAASAGVVRLIVGGEPVMLRATPAIDMDGVAVAVPPAGFMQASAAAEAAMREIALAAVGKAKRVVDLFCGAGAFTFALARKAEVVAVDSDAALVAALTTAARHAPGLKPIKAMVRDLFAEPLSRRELDAFDAVLLDPPRPGAKGQAEAIARSKVPVVVAISCNPATLARDARILVDGGYVIEKVVPIDQFVFTAHVEAVAIFRRAKR